MANAVEASEIAASNDMAMSKDIPTVTNNDQVYSDNVKDLVKDENSGNEKNVAADDENETIANEDKDKTEVVETSTELDPTLKEPDPEPEPEHDSDLESLEKQSPKPEIEDEQECDSQGDLKQISEPEVESKQSSQPESDEIQNQDLELEQELESEAGAEGEIDDDDDDDDEGDEEVEDEEENFEEKVEKLLDDDQDRRNPQYIPKGGAFYEHDNRTFLEDLENKDPQENEKKKKSWKESKESERWLHDCYNESEQLPKSTKEIIDTYGYDIRNEDAPPRARRGRKYGRGPDKYERSWEDEQAYLVKPNNIGRRLKKKQYGKDEFPPLPNQKQDLGPAKPAQKSLPRRKEEESSSRYRNSKVNGNDRSPGRSHISRHSSGNYNQLQSYNSNRKSYNHINKKTEDDVKPYRSEGSKWKGNYKSGKQDADNSKPIKSQTIRHSDPPFKRIIETNKNSVRETDVSHVTDGINQMTFHSRQVNMRDIRQKSVNGPEEHKINDAESESPANRQNPKRYSKIRKGFTGIFPPEEVPELDQKDMHKLQQEQQKSQHISMTQPLNMQNVMKRYTGTYDFVPGSTSYLGARPIISGIPQQGMSPQGLHQQTLSPQGIPQQALSPQVTSLQPIELQQNPLAQPNFVPQPMYIDMDAHFPSDVMGPYSAYPPYSGNQTGDVYQPPRGITYYNTECQNSGQKRPPPPRRQKAAIPIVRPPE